MNLQPSKFVLLGFLSGNPLPRDEEYFKHIPQRPVEREGGVALVDKVSFCCFSLILTLM